MKLSIFSHIVTHLYQVTLIPTIIFDLDHKPLNLDLTIDPQIIPIDLFEWNPNKICVFSNHHFAIARIAFQAEDHSPTILVVGPINLASTSDASVNYCGHTYYRGRHYTQLTPEDFNRHIIMINEIVNNQSLKTSDIEWHYSKVALTDKDDVNTLVEENLINRRMLNETFDSYQFELRFIEYLKRHDKTKINWILGKMNDTYQVSLSENRMEALRLKFSALTAVLTRTVISEGAPLNQALSLSDGVIQGLVKIKNPDEWFTYVQETIERFTALIQLFPLTNRSKLTKLTVNYIDNHLYEKISLTDLSKFTKRNASYLSTRFKQDTGKSIHTYISEQKVIEAQHLLLFSDFTAHEISTQLGFSSQSHFIKVFKQITQMTPRQYQEAHAAYYLA